MIYFLFLLAGQEAVVDNAHLVINCLTGLIAYPHMMVPDFFLRKKIKFTLMLTYPLSSLLHSFKLTLFLYKIFFFLKLKHQLLSSLLCTLSLPAAAFQFQYKLVCKCFFDNLQMLHKIDLYLFVASCQMNYYFTFFFQP